MNSGQEWTTGRGGPHGPGRAGIPSPARSAHRVRVNIAAPGLAGTERGRPGAGVPRTGLAPRSGPASLVTVVRSLLPVIRLLLARPAGEGAVGAEPAGDAEAHLKDRERGERRGVDVEVACADAVADDGAYRPFVVALPLAHPGPGRLGQAGGVPVGDQRLAAMGGVPWVMFLSGDEKAKPVVAQLIRDAGFDPFDLGGIDDSRLQDPSSALWINILTHDEATALVARVKSGDTAAAEQSARGRARAGRAIREAPRPRTGRSRVLPRAPDALGFRGRDQLARRRGQVGRYPGGVPRLRPGADRRGGGAASKTTAA